MLLLPFRPPLEQGCTFSRHGLPVELEGLLYPFMCVCVCVCVLYASSSNTGGPGRALLPPDARPVLCSIDQDRISKSKLCCHMDRAPDNGFGRLLLLI